MLPRTRGVRVEVSCQRSAHCSQILAPPVARAEWRPVLGRGGSQKPSAATARCRACRVFNCEPSSSRSLRTRSNSAVSMSSGWGLWLSRNSREVTDGSSVSSARPS